MKLPLFLLMVLCIGIVSADNLNIVLPTFEDFDQDTAKSFYFYPLNGSNILVDNTSTDCNYRVFMNNGTLKSTGPALYSGYWYFSLPVIDAQDKFEVAVWCNGSNTGFASGSYENKQKGVFSGFMWLVVLLPLVFAGLLLFATYGLSEEHTVLKVFAYFFPFIALWVAYYHSALILVNYHGFSALQESIGDITFYVGITFFVIVSYFIIYAIYVMVRTAAQDKQERLQY